jgi:O-methyltransferase
MTISKQLLATTPIITGAITDFQLEFLMDRLQEVLKANIPGAIVELGCNTGTTAIFIRKLLDLYESQKTYHVYDSFEGLPKKSNQDKFVGRGKDFVSVEHEKMLVELLKEGKMACPQEALEKIFHKFNLQLPTINKGWFATIPNEKYPEKICFAFLDGDFYSSIIDSFNKIYHKLVPGSVVCIHDYGWDYLPGVKKACTDFLNDKPESVIEGVFKLGFFVKE